MLPQAEVYPAALGAVVRSSASLAAFQAAATAGLSEFEMRFQYTGTRDYTPLAAMDAAMDFREIIGEEAIVQYNHSMAVWAQTSLAALWGTETLVPEECTVAMAHVRLPAVRSRKGAAKLGAMLKQLHNIHVRRTRLYPSLRHLFGGLAHGFDGSRSDDEALYRWKSRVPRGRQK